MKIKIMMVMLALSLFVVPVLLSDAATAVSDNVRDAQGVRRALLVGIDEYSPAYGPGPLPSCVNDALGVRDTIMLSDPGQRWSASSIQVLTNSLATFAAIRASLQSLATASQPGDLALYAHSSHGGQYSGTSVYLCAYDQDYSAVSLGQDLALFNPGVTVIVLVDACYSGGLFKQKDGWPFAAMAMQSYTETLTKQYQSKGLAVPKAPGTNIAFMTACDYSQTSLAGDPYSLYIGTVITGCLDSAVDANKDGLYQFSELHTYAAALATQKNPDQTAQQYNGGLLTSVVARSVGRIKKEGDFDGDGKADPYVVDALGKWYIFFSMGGYQSSGAVPLGQAGWQSVAGDFDGDGKADPAMVDALGNWYIWFSGNSYQCSGAIPLGQASWKPVVGDFDGDGKADPAMVDAHGNWYIWFSGNSYQCSGAIPLGLTGTPVAGDFDKDGKADPAMVDAHGNWYIWFSGNSYRCSGAIPLGHPNWKPVVGDFDGDGQADPALVSNNNWIFYFSGGGFAPQGPILLVP